MRGTAVLPVTSKSVHLGTILWTAMVTRRVVIVLEEVFAIIKKAPALASLDFMVLVVNIKQLSSKYLAEKNVWVHML
jgi:hypothetical protein